MHAWRQFIALAIATLLFSHNCTAQTRRGAEEIKPLFTQATLRVGDQVLKPARVSYPSRPEYWVGDRRFVVPRTRVAEIDAVTGEEQWTVNPPDAVQLRWLAALDDVAYLAAEPDPIRPDPPPDRNTDLTIPRFPRTSIRRLDLQKHEWLSPLSSNDVRLRDDFGGAIVNAHSVVVLSTATGGGAPQAANANESKRYAVACFQDGMEQAVWTKTFISNGESRRRGAGALWSATYPDYASSNIQPLSWLGNDVLICAGESQDLLCLDGADGHIKWQLARVWEFERSFIGPSVWNHFMTRFGLDDAVEVTARGEVHFENQSQQKTEEEKAKRALADAVKRFDEQTEAAIVGGPVVVIRQEQDERSPTRHIFVAVAKGPKSLWSGFLADCVLYELDEDGSPRALCKLPRTVLGRSFRSLPGGLAWCTQHGGVGRISLRTADAIGPGADDALCDIDWYKEFRPVSRKAWLVADPLNYVAAFSDQHLFRSTSGGYVREWNEQIYRFPITQIDLTTGDSRLLELAVPLEKRMVKPSTNVSRIDGRLHVDGPWLMAITGLEVDDAERTLRIVAGLKNSSASLEFRLSDAQTAVD
jgi:hypothetical protein